MNIIIENSYVFNYIYNILYSNKHNTLLWNPLAQNIWNVCYQFKPNLYIGTLFTSQLQQCLTQYKCYNLSIFNNE